MDNRELIEWAAKAAGYVIVGDVDQMIGQPDHRSGGYVICNDRGGEVCWNPLTDDGDALRLAVRLRMEVYHADDEGWAAYASYPTANGRIAYAVEQHGDDPFAASRRAIVRAAAATIRSSP